MEFVVCKEKRKSNNKSSVICSFKSLTFTVDLACLNQSTARTKFITWSNHCEFVFKNCNTKSFLHFRTNMRKKDEPHIQHVKVEKFIEDVLPVPSPLTTSVATDSDSPNSLETTNLYSPLSSKSTSAMSKIDTVALVSIMNLPASMISFPSWNQRTIRALVNGVVAAVSWKEHLKDAFSYCVSVSDWISVSMRGGAVIEIMCFCKLLSVVSSVCIKCCEVLLEKFTIFE